MDAVPPGELGDDVEPDTAVGQQAGDVDLVGVGEHGVHPLLLGDGHAQPAVLDLHGEAGGDEVGAEQHLGVRGGEHRGVLDEFGEQVDDVGDGVAAQFAVDGRHQSDPGVLLDLGDGGAQHLGHADGVAPLPPGDRAAEHGEVLGVPADAGGQVVDVEEPLEQIGVLDLVLQVVQDRDLPVHQGLEPPREVDEHLQLLLAAGLAGELGGPYDGGDGAVVRARQIGGEQFEVVGVGGRPAARAALRRRLTLPERVDQGVQVGLAARGGAAQRVDAVGDRAGGAVGGHGGDQDAGDGHGDRSGEHGPQEGAGARAGGTDAEQHRGGGAERDREGRQDGEPHQLGPYVCFGQCGSGSGDRSPVPAALAAIGAGGRCSEVRHLRPRTGPSGLGPRAVRGAGMRRCGHASSLPAGGPVHPAARRPADTHSSCLSIMCGGQLTKSPEHRPALV